MPNPLAHNPATCLPDLPARGRQKTSETGMIKTSGSFSYNADISGDNRVELTNIKLDWWF